MPDNLNYGVKLEIGRGRGAEAVQGVALVSDTTPIEIIAGQAEKTLYLNHIVISITDQPANHLAYLTDGSGGTAFWAMESFGQGYYRPGSYTLDFGEYGFALSEGNGLFGSTTHSLFDITVVALGCFR